MGCLLPTVNCKPSTDFQTAPGEFFLYLVERIKASIMRRLLLLISGILLNSTLLYSQQPQFSIQALFGPTGYVWDNSGSSDVKADFNYSAGAYIQANIPVQESRIFFRSGYYVDTKYYSINLSNTYSWYSKIEREFIYSNVPILFGVQFNSKDKLFPFMCLGVVFGKVLEAEQVSTRNDGLVVSGITGKSTVLENPKDMYVGFGVDVRIYKFLFARAEPFLSYQLDEGSGYNVDVQGRISYGLKIGLSFDIFLPFLEQKPHIENP